MIEALENPALRRLAQPISVDGYHLLRDVGLVGIKTELIHGVVVEKMSKSPLHTYLVNALLRLLSNSLPEGYWLRKEDPLSLADSEPEPDISVVAGRARDFKTSHPRSAAWVIEVAVSSLELDREKATIYAAAGIAEYWLVNAVARQVEVYREPRAGVYAQTRVYPADAVVPTPFGAVLELARVFEA
jgi:Uma2 family endonuclease